MPETVAEAVDIIPETAAETADLMPEAAERTCVFSTSAAAVRTDDVSMAETMTPSFTLVLVRVATISSAIASVSEET